MRTRDAVCTAGVVLALAGCASAVPRHAESKVAPVDTSATRVVDLNGATVRIPSAWHFSRYRGEVATVYFPLAYVSDHRLRGPCLTVRRSADECTQNNWFPPGAVTPEDGVLLLWAYAEFPFAGRTLRYRPGRATTVDGRPASVYFGAVLGDCPAGATHELVATVQESTGPASGGDYFQVSACFGSKAPAADRTAAYAMLRSLRITR